MATSNLTQFAGNTTLAITELQNVAVAVQVSVTPVAGDLAVWAGSPVALGDLSSVATGSVLLSAGVATAPTWGQVGTAAIATSAVTYAKLQNESTVTLLGNPTGAPAAPSEITLGTGLSFAGSVLNGTGLVYLGTINVVSTAISDTTIIAANSGTYRSFKLIFKNILPATTSSTLSLQVHSGGTFQATSYLGTVFANSGSASSNANSTTGLQLTTTTGLPNTSPGFAGDISVSNLAGTGDKKQWFGNGLFVSTTTFVTMFGGNWNGGNGAIDGFQLVSSVAGGFTSGSVDIYGIL